MALTKGRSATAARAPAYQANIRTERRLEAFVTSPDSVITAWETGWSAPMSTPRRRWMPMRRSGSGLRSGKARSGTVSAMRLRANGFRPKRSASRPIRLAPRKVPVMKLPARSEASTSVRRPSAMSAAITKPVETVSQPSNAGEAANGTTNVFTDAVRMEMQEELTRKRRPSLRESGALRRG